MAWTKRQFIAAALDELGLANYIFDAQPEQLQSALRRLDGLMAEWNSKGIRLRFPLPASPGDSDLDDDSGVPDYANEAIVTNLALRVASSYGRQPMPQTRIAAAEGYRTVLRLSALPTERQFPETLPKGAGNKHNEDPFMPEPIDPVLVGRDGPLAT